jgi:hypothetical protein
LKPSPRFEVLDEAAKRLSERLALRARQRRMITIEARCSIVCRHVRLLVERRQEGLGILERLTATVLDVVRRLALAGLPGLRPEPGLIGGDGHTRPQLENTVLPLDQLYLCPRLVKMMAPADVARQRDEPAILEREELRVLGHVATVTALLFYCNTAKAATSIGAI